jgi:hypothetical protein
MGFLCSSMAFKTHLFQNIPWSICSFVSLCLAIYNHTWGKKHLNIGHFHHLFKGQIKLVHVCLFLEMKLFGIKFILFSNRKHIIYVWSLACLIIGFNQSIAHGRICVNKRLDYFSPLSKKCYLACFKPKWRHVNGERGDLINLKDGKWWENKC